MFKIGEIEDLTVARITDIGYMLKKRGDELVFLHNNETNFKELKVGDKVKAFLYYDNKGRMAATLYEPILTKDQSGWLEVGDVNLKLGVFLKNGINKDLLLSKDDLPKQTSLWPAVGAKLYVSLKVKSRLVAKPAEPFVNQKLETFQVGDKVLARVVRIYHEKVILLTENLTPIIVDLKNIRKATKLGEVKEVTINHQKKDAYEGSLILNKEVQLIKDAEMILTHLKSTKKMRLNSDSTPDEIFKWFNMSKKAFKRALGHLYKERLIYFKDDYTYLLEGDNDE